MIAVFKKELRAYFTSMIGYIFIAIFIAFVSFFFMINNLMGLSANFSYALSGIKFPFLVLVSVLTMRIIAEENRQKTDQLLYTAPVSIGKIILGKYLAAISLLGIGLLVICVYPLILSSFGDVDMAIAYGSILGFFVLGSAYIALGMFCSSLTESPVIAAVISFGAMLLTFLMTSIASILPTDHFSVLLMFLFLWVIFCVIVWQMVRNGWAATLLGIVGILAFVIVYMIKPELYDNLMVNMVSSLSILDQYNNFNYGIFDISILIYYVSVCFIFVFVTVQKVKKQRWS